jgi:mutator protein MutT
MIIDKVLVIASAVIKNKQGKVLLLQRSKKSSYPGYWQLVEGKLEANESPSGSLKREIKEEIGVNETRIEMKNIFYSEIEAKGLKYLCIRVVYDTKISSYEIKTSDEHVSFGWFDMSEIVKLILLPGTEKVIEKVL